MIVETEITQEKFTDIEPGTLFYFTAFERQQLGLKVVSAAGEVATVCFTAAPHPQTILPALLTQHAVQNSIVLAMPTATIIPVVTRETMRSETPEYPQAGAFSFVDNRRLLRCVRGVNACDVDLGSGEIDGLAQVKFWVTSWNIELPNRDRSQYQRLLSWPLPAPAPSPPNPGQSNTSATPST